MAGALSPSSTPSQAAPPATPPKRVALFISCAADLAMAPVATATRQLLEALGVEVEVPSAQSCCGQVALNTGHRGPAEKVARHWIDTFADYDAVVSPSGSCVSTVHHAFPRLAAGTWAEAAADAGRRTWELTQFLAAYGADLPLALEARVAWHDSCHMLRMLGEKQAPRVVLQRVHGLTLHEVADSESCCGFGGTFATKFPDLSCAMADRKLASAYEAGVTHLVSADPGCLLHLGGRNRAVGPQVRTVHIAELLAEALSPATTATGGRTA